MLNLRKILLGGVASSVSLTRGRSARQQSIANAVRPVFFQTDMEEFLYATHGGTLFLIKFQDRIYGLTCAHVFQDFPKGSLFVTQEKNGTKGSKPAPVAEFCFPSAPKDGAVGTDIEDICVVAFDEAMEANFFKGGVYVFDAGSVATARIGHELFVPGVLKEKSRIELPDITIGYSQLQLQDTKSGTSDPILRTAVAEFAAPDFSNVTGMSGSPVFDISADVLCGMVVRGGMDKNKCTLHYIDIFDIAKFLEGVAAHADGTYYTKTLAEAAL